VEALYCPLKLTISSKSILIKVNFSREALMLAGVAEVLVAFSIRMVLMLAAFAWFHVNFAPTMILGVFVALVLVALGFNLGVLLAPIGVLYHDVERALAILTVTWFFVTPVVYPVPSSWPASTLARINPVTPLLATARELFAGQAVSQIEGFFIVTCLTLCLTFAGLVLYRVSLPHIIERMGG
jgi:lipopolysaccharide transport system permease protein